MPPARGSCSEFTGESIEDFILKPSASLEDVDESFYEEKTDIMDLDEFLVVHEGKSLEEELPSQKKRATSDLLSDLLQTVHKNLGIPRGSQPSAFKLPNESSKANSLTDNYIDDDYDPHFDHEYIIKRCKVEDVSDEEEQQNDDDPQSDDSRQKLKRRKPRTYRYNPKPVQQKSSRNFVPDAKKDLDYWEKRKRNNLAAKKSREDRRRKELEVLNKMAAMEKRNSELMAQVKSLEESNKLLMKKLKESTGSSQ